MIKIMCWLWRQRKSRTQYTAEHVNIWARMVSRHLTIPHTLACVTDIPEGIDSHIEIIPLPKEFADVENDNWSANRGLPQCYRRLTMFAPDAAQRFGAERFASMDIDCVIDGEIDSVFSRPEDFVMYKGTSPRRPYNGSLMLMTAGARPQVYDKFTVERARAASSVYMGSDQAWIGYVLGWTEATWGEEDGVYFMGGGLQKRLAHRNEHAKPDNLKILFFPGAKIKPWASGVPWIQEAWR